MGWSMEIERHCGKPPEWAEVLPQGAESSQEFLAKIHCLVPGVGCCAENWPRIGLEAMAAGVPIVAEEKGGWMEMLGEVPPISTVTEQSDEVNRLACDERARGYMLACQLERVGMLADADVIGEQWIELFEGLQ